MHINNPGLGIAKQEKWLENLLHRHDDDDEKSVKNGKHFVRCICPKCTIDHKFYMMWTGRGVPRKYCASCKPLISSYDDVALYEVCVSASGHSKKKGGCQSGE